MRRFHGLFTPSGAFFRLQFSADYTITMFGFDFRQGQATAIVAAVFERETLGQRWSGFILYSTLMSQVDSGRPEASGRAKSPIRSGSENGWKKYFSD
jgi:hypothetical protein